MNGLRKYYLLSGPLCSLLILAFSSADAKEPPPPLVCYVNSQIVLSEYKYKDKSSAPSDKREYASRFIEYILPNLTAIYDVQNAEVISEVEIRANSYFSISKYGSGKEDHNPDEFRSTLEWYRFTAQKEHQPEIMALAVTGMLRKCALRDKNDQEWSKSLRTYRAAKAAE